ncbi:hypothetical protein L208DRAFT_1255421, partial [Tricholoma matsutake]
TVHMLSCITSLIAVITRRPPTPFGTQHIALILAGWGPVIVFSTPTVFTAYWIHDS